MGKPKRGRTTPAQRAAIMRLVVATPAQLAAIKIGRELGKLLSPRQFAEMVRNAKTAAPSPPPPPPPQRKPRKPGGGRKPKFKAQEQRWLQATYSRHLKKDRRLANRKLAVDHVQKLAMTEYGIEVGRNTLLAQIIRPVLRQQ
jgi:hypothetical protein